MLYITFRGCASQKVKSPKDGGARYPAGPGLANKICPTVADMRSAIVILKIYAGKLNTAGFI